MARRTDDPFAWLRSDPTLDELRAAYPQHWQAVQRDVARLTATGDDMVASYLRGALSPAPRDPGRMRPRRVVLAEEIRRRMIVEALRQANLAAETGVQAGTIRFNRLNGRIAQRVFFARGLERRPVSMTAYRTTWPLLWQRRLLMPLVRPQGIYCFYSSAFVDRLTALIAGRRCLEIAAGDGTLSRFLRERGVDVIATDDYSWSHVVNYPEDVLRQQAARALRIHAPQVVVCSWPPPGNTFERHVFSTASVELYVVIGSRTEREAGDWPTYRQQTDFEMRTKPRLSRLVLPAGANTVTIFSRRTAASG